MVVVPYGELFFKDGKKLNENRKKLLNKIIFFQTLLINEKKRKIQTFSNQINNNQENSH